jgi:peptidyl-dipeptidase A
MRFTLFASVLAIAAALTGCGKSSEPAATTVAPAAQQAGDVTPARADAFIAQYNEDFRKLYPAAVAAQWMQANFITEDSQLLASKANEGLLEFSFNTAQAAKPFYALKDLKPETARALTLIRVGATAPSKPEQREELAKLGSKMEANYGTGKWCHKDAGGNEVCESLPEIERVINNVDFKYTPEQIAEAWAGWHATAKPIRSDYTRFIELLNGAASESGFANMGEMWRAGYDMTPAEFAADTERLWGQVKPLYEGLHCYVRGKLNEKYGDAVVPKDGMIPAHLLGNMWAQQWGNLYPILQPYQGVGSLDVTSALAAQRDAELAKLKAGFKGKPSAKDLAEMEYKANAAQSVAMTKLAEDFYVSLGFPKLPETFWTRSLLTKPRDREVVCHASAWDLNLKGDVRIKQCIEPDEEQLTTIYHELGHVYYFLAYNHLEPIFQAGAQDGFHEAIGDVITLSMTPKFLEKIGLVNNVVVDEKATINSQMKLALDKITFLPWGKLVDQWRWKVMSGEIKPDAYNQGWWDLRAQYQGVSPPLARTESDFDPGAKYHIPGNTPYTRYFLSFVLQFQFQKALCDAAGFKGPLHECDVYGNAAAGEKFRAMLAKGASQPWQDTLFTLTGSKQMDATALVEYFGPLMGWLKTQNEGQSCGWTAAP